MIYVPVSDENGIKPGDLFQIFRAPWIRHHERVDDCELATRRGQAERAVPEIGDFISFQIKHGNLLGK
jgi:hypothetical protein